MKNLHQDLRLKIRNNEAFSDEEKNQLLELLNERKKYGLVWEDKPENVETQMRQQLPVFVEVPALRITAKSEEVNPVPVAQFTLDLPDTDTQSANTLAAQQEPPHHVLIEGDNLHALTALAFAIPEKVDVIYIDPPYNTGNKDFIYNDTFVDREDGYRHSKWLSFMHKRLQIAKKLLKDTGVIFISIDDNEQAQLKLLCDEVFGEENFVANICLKNKAGAGAKPKGFIAVHEYILVYAQKSELIKSISLKSTEDNKLYNKKDEKYPLRGPYGTWALATTSMADRPNLRYPIIHNGEEIWPEKQWLWAKERVIKAQSNDELVFNKMKNGKWSVRFKQYLKNENGELRNGTPITVFDGPYTQEGTKDLDEVLNSRDFVFPKPKNLIKKLFELKINNLPPPSVILDFFAGSGTTLHAVMQLNAEDGGNRQCILVTNNENNIAREVCYERNKRVIEGYKKPNGGAVKGLTNNHLHYMQVDFAERSSALNAKLDLVRKSTDLLRLKENCWDRVVDLADTVDRFGKSSRFPTSGQEFGQELDIDLGNLEDFLNQVKSGLALYKNDINYLLIVYDDHYIREAVVLIGHLEPLSEKVTTEYVLAYVFSDSPYDYREEFEDVLDKVRLCALPEAIYNALRGLI